MVPGYAGVLVMVMHLGALVDVPPHERAAVTQRLPEVNAAGNVTVVIGTADPPNVQLYVVAPTDTPHA